jgi:hypothetical protein
MKSIGHHLLHVLSRLLELFREGLVGSSAKEMAIPPKLKVFTIY